MKGQAPSLTYRLFVRGLQGKGFKNRTQLLDDIARRIQAGEVGNELLTLPEWGKRPEQTWIAARTWTCPRGSSIDLPGKEKGLAQRH